MTCKNWRVKREISFFDGDIYEVFSNRGPDYELSKKGNTGGKYEGFVNSW